MKIQFQVGLLRVRIDEAELARLLSGSRLTLQVACAGQAVFSLTLGLADSLALRTGEAWQLDLPADQVRAYALSLPRRDALGFELAAGMSPLRLDFEVDVRDSRKLRGPNRR